MTKFLRLTAAGVIGLVLYLGIAQTRIVTAAVGKATGANEPCPWGKLARLPWDLERFVKLKKDFAAKLRVIDEDRALGIVRVQSPTRPFWIKKDGVDLNGISLLAYVLAEEEWIMGSNGADPVRPGDVVMDVGAHIGSFGDDALRRGASKVIMIEPDPVNVECIRRNFAAEIKAGRVIVVPEGAWSKADVMKFHVGIANSGTGSLYLAESGSSEITVQVRRIDDMLTTIGVKKVDFVKMDIEGAEREALAGATRLLRDAKPRIMLDSYHLPDDSTVLPNVIRTANRGYRQSCAVCGFGGHGSTDSIIPYAVFYN